MNGCKVYIRLLAAPALIFLVWILTVSGASAENIFSDSTVRDITIRDGIVWCATDTGVLKLDSATSGQRLYTSDDGLLDSRIATVAANRLGDVWAGSNSGVARLEDDAWAKMTLPGNQRLDETMRILFAPEGNIWICTPMIQYQYNGLIWLSWALENVQRYAAFHDAAIEPDGTVWFGTAMGLLSYREYAWSNHINVQGGPGRTDIHAVAVDAEGAVWCGTNTGIFRYRDGTWTQYGSDGLYGPVVRDIVIDASGVPWASATGQDGAGVSHFTDGSWKQVLPASETGGSAPLCIEFGNDGDMWLGSTAGLFRFDMTSLRVGSLGDGPRSTAILGNHPNPFNPETTISFEITESRNARLAIFNITGQKVRSLVTGTIAAGVHTVLWDGRDDNGQTVATGMYLAALSAGDRFVSHRMTLVR